MNVEKRKKIFVGWALAHAVTLSLFFGCAQKIQKPLPVCPGKNTAAEALAALQAQSENMVPIFTRGTCKLLYDPNEPKQNFNIKVLLIKPPFELYLQADTGIISKAVVIGSNENEFWLAVRPNEIDSYWWGLWSEQNSGDAKGILINPRTLLESLGIAEINTTAEWSLSKENGYDILTKKIQGITVKKLHIYCCDYTVRTIEYFDNDGKPVAIAELDDYTQVTENFSIPASIEIYLPLEIGQRPLSNGVNPTISSENREDQFNIKFNLTPIRQAKEKEKNFAIVRDDDPQGFKHIYKVINGQWYEQQNELK